ncbi:hypothetical protein HPP92_010158 [Vanilla planifolia]|uniref:Uncharacterized protein n=1 Tax=Vanilla planifolia TaxID=51239 RepID=A0A835R0C9_VANPL|nr:hypothetical protein HPP92_010382 [Vanilla planifolia]KAG0482074.1 hypothetical protein HPP92_010158 [Vanilla planifolia]
MPDDFCPLGAQLIESPPQIASFDSKHDYASQEQVMPPLFVIDDDANVEVCERPEDPLLQLNTNSTCLLSINELHETMGRNAALVNEPNIVAPCYHAQVSTSTSLGSFVSQLPALLTTSSRLLAAEEW